MLIRRATSMNRATLPILMLAAMFGIVHIAVAAPFLNEMAEDFEVSKAVMGQLSTITSAASVLAAIAFVPFVDRLPLRPVLALGTAGVCITSVLTGLVPWFAGLVIVRFAAGIAAGVLIPGCFAALGRTWQVSADRAKRQGFIIAAFVGGPGLLAPILRLVANGADDWRIAMFAAGAFVIAQGFT